uniref:Spermatogenesis associated 7 n=1 Tax=Cynoglossus semilaevis TaxID=244447 RepID=A0A3P8UYI3_CYNSE
MGYAEFDINMESRTAFCSHSSSKLTQSIVRDHMVSHYKKVYSAKAAIDNSVPRSMVHSVKYNDQIQQDRVRKGSRPQSARSLPQKHSRAFRSPAQSRLSMQYDDGRYLYSRSSVVSSPGFGTSFHVKDIDYPSHKPAPPHHSRPASQQLNARNLEAALIRKQSALSLAASGGQSLHKSFQDPFQKTYSGDLLQKHSQNFTPDKPFTPKTLKSDRSSYLEKYRYYRAPRRKPTQDCSNSEQDTNIESTKPKECTQDVDEPSQGFISEQVWFEEELNSTYFLASRPHGKMNRSRDCLLFDSSSRVSSDRYKSALMRKVNAEEEELKYLEFISAVTEDILTRSFISDRVIERVMKRHIDMNRHQLDEDKMRHLLVVLRKDFEEPTNTPTSRTGVDKRTDLVDSLLPYLESEEKRAKTRGDSDVFSNASVNKRSGSPHSTEALSTSTPLHPTEKAASSTNTNRNEQELDSQEKSNGSPQLSELLSENTPVNEEEFQNNQITTTYTSGTVSTETQQHTSAVSSEEGSHQDRAEVSPHGQSPEVEDLGRCLSESLQVSSNTSTNENTTNDQRENTDDSSSDDDF